MGLDIRQLNIFVEGDADRVFIRDVLKVFYQISLNESQLKETVFVCKSYNNLKHHKDEFLKVNVGGKKEGGRNVVIFDADITGNAENNGFESKCNYLDNIKAELEVNFDYYLFPDNFLDGTLEIFLEACIPDKHQRLMSCWNDLEKCVSMDAYTIPADKSRIYFYLECLHGHTANEKGKIKDPNRNYTDENLWIFDFVNSNTVKRLKEFLDIYLL